MKSIASDVSFEVSHAVTVIGSPELTGVGASEKLSRRTVVEAMIVSLAAVLLVQISTVKYQLSLGDETWLWYGVQRTLAGDWPVRDFWSYDPGRYLLLDGWFRLCRSDHLLTLRYGLAVFQWLGLFPAALLAARILRRRWLWILFTLLISCWMAPRHKLVDIAITIWVTGALVWLIDQPTAGRYRMVGLLIGLIWMLGRNHALYAFISAMVVWAYLCWARWPGVKTGGRRLGWLMQGLFVGSLPMIALLATVPHYAVAYWRIVIDRQIEIGATNLFVPVPWPWRSPLPWNTWNGMLDLAMGCGFVLIPVLAIIGLCLLVQHRRTENPRGRAALLAATATSIGWANHAFSRADLSHLAQVGLPLAVLLIAIPPMVPRVVRISAWTASACIVVAMTALFLLRINPAVSALVRPAERFSWQRIDGRRFYVSDSTTAAYRLTREVVRQAGRWPRVLIVPYEPGLYAIFRLKCPIFESYLLYPASKAEQQQAIADLRKSDTQWVICWPDRMDGRADLGFDQTDALVWQYIQRDFRPVAMGVPTEGAHVLRKDSTVPTTAPSIRRAAAQASLNATGRTGKAGEVQ